MSLRLVVRASYDVKREELGHSHSVGQQARGTWES